VVRAARKPAAEAPARAISPLEPLPAAATKKTAPAVVRSADGSCLEVSLSAVWQNWPAAARDEAVQMGLAEATLRLPIDTVKQGLKRGLLSYSWKTLRGWLVPGVPSALSANDATPLTLPLVLIAPAFLSLQGDTVQRRKLALDSTIPDLFQAGSQPKPPERVPEPAAGAKLSAPPTLPAAEPVPVLNLAREQEPVVPAAPTPEPAAQPTLEAESEVAEIAPSYCVETPAQPVPFTPEEIVYRATALKGIAGALVTLADGLPVANRLPSGASAESLAALVPQLFNRVGASLKEFQMGELTRLRFCAEEVPWEILRIGKVYVAAFGRVGESFPEEELRMLVSGMENVG
jgi:predicted regulator of Ras-like GTPase activity (Roadblock/LC7/MglB family)